MFIERGLSMAFSSSVRSAMVLARATAKYNLVKLRRSDTSIPRQPTQFMPLLRSLGNVGVIRLL